MFLLFSPSSTSCEAPRTLSDQCRPGLRRHRGGRKSGHLGPSQCWGKLPLDDEPGVNPRGGGPPLAREGPLTSRVRVPLEVVFGELGEKKG